MKKNQKIVVGSDHDHEKIKIMRRESERQRRQQMAFLFTTLRTMLPLESTKGNCSIPDQVNVAVDYIKHLKWKIQELNIKKENLIKGLNDENDHQLYQNEGCSTSTCSPSTTVMIRPYSHGLEIVISRSLTEEGKQHYLSRVLKLLLEEDIDVDTCAAMKAMGKIYHTIQATVEDLSLVDQPRLQQKLFEACNSE